MHVASWRRPSGREEEGRGWDRRGTARMVRSRGRGGDDKQNAVNGDDKQNAVNGACGECLG